MTLMNEAARKAIDDILEMDSGANSIDLAIQMFRRGCAWQREQDAGICEEEARTYMDAPVCLEHAIASKGCAIRIRAQGGDDSQTKGDENNGK